MESKKVKQIGLAAFVILFGLFLVLARKAKYNEFHKSHISGKIDTIYRYKDYVMFDVDSQEYRIIPVAINNAKRLDNIAIKGDSLSKAADHDTLTLIHQKYNYYYTVEKW